MKKLGCIVLLLTIVLQMGGLLLAYHTQQSLVRHRMARLVHKKKHGFQKLRLSLSEFRKCTVKKNEICYAGKMYDVKSCAVSGDVVDLLVVHDTKEEKIAKKIAKLLHQDKQRSHQLDNLVHLLTLVYLCPVAGNNIVFRQFHKSDFAVLYEHTISVAAAVISPPPDLG